MFARLTIFEIKIDRIDEAVKIYGESVVPEAKCQKGYCGIYLFIDHQSGKGISISLWKSEKDAVANEKSRYYQEQVAKFIAFYTKPPIREGYEVSIADWMDSQ